MYTGLVEEVGMILDVREDKKATYKRFRISCKGIRRGMKLGDSIAVNGVCHTVVALNRPSFTRHFNYAWFEVESFQKTLEKTNFLQLKQGSLVNLEQSAKASTKMGGHIVSGVVQTTAKIEKIDRQGENTFLYIVIPQSDMNLVIEEGSICVNGISLSIAEIKDTIIMINVILHTLNHTNLRVASADDQVNIEYDKMLKYLHKMSQKYFNQA